jgi:hypothetical protein
MPAARREADVAVLRMTFVRGVCKADIDIFKTNAWSIVG